MSFGVDESVVPDAFHDAVAIAAGRDVLMSASSGNSRGAVEWPAKDPAVIGVGGIDSSGTFWDEGSGCGASQQSPDTECGSNFGPEQELVAPAKFVLSTTYTGHNHHVFPDAIKENSCGDAFGTEDDVPGDPTANDANGFGLCTGTSMSSPYVAGVAGILRSTNPLLSQEHVREALTSTGSQGGVHSSTMGYGIPDAQLATGCREPRAKPSDALLQPVQLRGNGAPVHGLAAARGRGSR